MAGMIFLAYPAGFSYLTVVVVSITATALIARLASRRGVPSLDLALALFGVSAVIGATVVFSQRPLNITSNSLVFSTVAGVGGALAVLAFNQAVGAGHFGFSNAIYRSSFLLPVLYSVWFLGATLTAWVAAGIALILAGIFLMSWSGAADRRSQGNAPEWRWLGFILCAFLFSGAPRIGQILTSLHGENYHLYLCLSYSVGAILLFPVVLIRRSFKTSSLPWGAGAALASYMGVFCTLKALETLKPPVVFPISLSGPIILGMVLSLVLFKERITPAGWLGVIFGVSGILALAIFK